MKKYIFLIITAFLLLPTMVSAKEVNLYLFYGNGCPHCSALEEYLDSNYNSDDDLNIYRYEVWYDEANQKLWEEVGEAMDVTPQGVPYLVVGEQVIQGFMEGVTEDQIDDAIKTAQKTSYTDKAGIVLGIEEGTIEDTDDNSDNNSSFEEDKKEIDLEDIKEKNNKEENKEINFSIPLIGNVNLADFSLPVIAIIIGLVDGFNPCAMWILIFLITMLFDYPKRNRMWILGITFLVTSAFIYFLFMISFLNLAMFINSITILKIGLALFALIFGSYNIYRYIKTRKDTGCEIVNKERRKKIITKIKNITENKKFILALGGIIVLACTVNIIELLCSLGLPVMFTEILASNNVTSTQNIIYILIYVFFFLLDDLVVFIIAMKTLKITAISNKYGKCSHLIGGIIMILIGLLMIFKPEWLMFNF